MESLLILGIIIEFIGSACLAVSIMLVHQKIEEEHGIDRAVLRTLRKDQWLAMLGLIFMTLGFGVEIVALVRL